MMKPSSHIAAYFNGIIIGNMIYDHGFDRKKFENYSLNLYFEYHFIILYFLIPIFIYVTREEVLTYNATLFAFLPVITPIVMLYLFERNNIKNEEKIPRIIFEIYRDYSIISFFYRMLIFVYINQLNLKFQKMITFICFHPVFCISIKMLVNKKIEIQ